MSIRLLIIPLFLIAVIFSVWFSLLKFDALDYHTRDFAFFAQTQAKLLDNSLTSRLSLNPNGHSFLGFRGTECEKSIHQGIHFAPIKYIHSVLYFITGDLLLVFVLNSLIVFFPALYLSFYYRKGKGIDKLFYLVLSLCYLIYPSIQHFAAYDLRHYIFLTPFFITAVLALFLERSSFEKLFFFNLLFFAREEALILGCVVIFYAIATARTVDTRGILRSLIPWYLVCYAFWYAAIVSYFIWTGYRQEAPFITQALLPIGFLVLGCAAIVVLRKFTDRIIPQKSRELSGFIALLLSFGPFIYHGGVWRQVDFYSILYFNRYFLYAGCGFLSIAALWPLLSKRSARIFMLSCVCFACVFFIYANSPMMKMANHVSFRERPITVKIKDYLKLKKNGQLVHTISNNLDYRTNFILTDYKTHQAFYDFENVIVYQRLPWYLAQGSDRYYPKNKMVLQELLRSKIEYIVISKGSYKDVQKEIRATGLQEHVKMIDRNKSFLILTLSRGDEIK